MPPGAAPAVTVRQPDDGSGDAVISASGLTKRFGGGVLAVDDLTFSVARGQVCGLLGPNGAGKTTTLRILLGLIRPTRGRARLFGQEIRPSHPVLARVGALIEESAFVPYLSGRVNLRYYWESTGADWADARLDEALAVARLGDAIDRRVKTYSHGMRQRLGIARALLARPEMLVLDEPTNGLDPQEMREIRQLIRRLAESGVTVLLSSHLLGEVEQMCSHAVVMNEGRLVASGTVGDLMGQQHNAYVEVDDVGRARAVLDRQPGVRAVRSEPPGLVVELDGIPRSDLVPGLVAAGVAVQTITSRHRLEDAFLGLLDEEQTR